MVFLLAVAAYGNTLQNGFAMNDRYNIVENSRVRSLSQAPAFFTSAWGTRRNDRAYWRPLAMLSFAIDYQLWQLEPAGYHLTNLILHGMAAAMLCMLLLTLTRQPMAALAGALIFALHPVQTEAVNLVSYRTELMAGLFVVLGLRSLYSTWPLWVRSLLLALAYAAGLASKEMAVTLPLWVAIAMALYPPPTLSRSYLRSTGLLLGPSFLVLVGYFALRAMLLRGSGADFFAGLDPMLKVMSVMKILQHYGQLLVFPWPLMPFYDWTVLPPARSLADLGALAGLFIVSATLVLAWICRRRLPLVALGILWFFVGLLPTLQLLPLPVGAAERFLYLPLVGFGLAIGIAFAALWLRHKRAALVGGLVLVALMTLGVVERNGHWRSDLTLQQHAVAAHPQSFNSQLTLAKLYRKAGQPEAAIRHLLLAEKLMPGMRVTASWLAGTLLESGRKSEACKLLSAAIRKHGPKPDLARLMKSCP